MEGSVLTKVVIPVALAVIMLGVGLALTVADFRRVAVMPKAVFVGLLVPNAAVAADRLRRRVGVRLAA